MYGLLSQVSPETFLQRPEKIIQKYLRKHDKKCCKGCHIVDKLERIDLIEKETFEQRQEKMRRVTMWYQAGREFQVEETAFT